MTIILEVSRPFIRPGWFVSRQIYRVYFGWFAISLLRIPYIEWLKTPKQWLVDGKDVLACKDVLA